MKILAEDHGDKSVFSWDDDAEWQMTGMFHPECTKFFEGDRLKSAQHIQSITILTTKMSAEKVNSIAKRGQEVLILCMNIHVGHAYKPHPGCHSRKLNVWVLVHVQTARLGSIRVNSAACSWVIDCHRGIS